MSWFSSRRGSSGDRHGRQTPDPSAAPGGPQEHRSLALAALCQAIAGQAKLQVLDLGPAVGGNIEFLSRFGCKLYIQDLYAALAPHLALAEPTPAPNRLSLGSAINADRAAVREARETWEARQQREAAQGEGASVASRLGELLTYPAETRFDAVLVWDLLNYFDRREVAALAHALVRFCRPGALVFALVSIVKQIPAQPMRFRILDQEHLAYEIRTPALMPCTRYAPAELNELLRGFRLDRSFLMRHGVQEYLFAREP
jgi:hypothetical protein